MACNERTREELLFEIEELKEVNKNLQNKYKSEIEELKNSRQQLQLSEEKWKFIFKNAPDAIYLYDLKGNFIDGNYAAEKLLGYDKHELIGKSFLKLKILPPKYIKLASKHLSQNLLGLSTGPEEFILNHKDGTEVFVELSTLPAKFNNKTIVLGIARNTTYRIKAENELRFFKAIIDGTNDAIEVIDPETARFLDVNKKGCTDLGYSHQELKQLTVFDIDPKVSKSIFTAIISQLKIENNFTFEGIHVRKDSSSFPVEVNLKLVDYGKKYLVSVVRDITHRKKTEERLRKSEEKFRTIFNESPIGIELYNKKGLQTDANKASLEMFGIPDVSEIINFNIFEGTSLSDTQKENLKNGKSISYQAFFDFDKIKELAQYNTVKSGKAFFDYNITCLKDKTSKYLAGYLLHVQDITKKKFAEDEYLKLHRAVEQSPTSILISDLDGNIEYANPKVIESSGFSLNEIIGKNPRIFNSGQKSAEEYSNMWLTISSGNEWRGEFLNKRKTGELYWELASISPIFNEKGEIINYLAVKEDITERKIKNTELKLAKEKAEESDKLKSAFLSNMSHEVRTPLNSIIGFSELLTDLNYDDIAKKDFTKQIIFNSYNLLSIISDIMDISKIESGELKLYKSEVEVNSFLNSIIDEFEFMAKNKNLDFKYTKTNSNNIIINVDKDRLTQVLNNIISNAVKFTPSGEIELAYSIIENSIRFRINDTGIGIPIEFHDEVFKRFRQIEKSETRKYGGNGLGLAISKNLIELMEGKIWFESEQGNGTTFYITFPCHALENTI